MRTRAAHAVLASVGPHIPSIWPWKGYHLESGLVGPLDGHRLAGAQGHLAPARSDRRVAAAHRDARFSRLVHIDPIATGSLERHGGIRSVDFERLVAAQTRNREGGYAGLDGKLFDVVTQVQRGEIGSRAEANHSATLELKLHAPVICVDAVAKSHRYVLIGALPLIRVIPPCVRDVALDIGNASDGLGDVLIVVAEPLRRSERRYESAQENDRELESCE